MKKKITKLEKLAIKKSNKVYFDMLKEGWDEESAHDASNKEYNKIIKHRKK